MNQCESRTEGKPYERGIGFHPWIEQQVKHTIKERINEEALIVQQGM